MGLGWQRRRSGSRNSSIISAADKHYPPQILLHVHLPYRAELQARSEGSSVD